MCTWNMFCQVSGSCVFLVLVAATLCVSSSDSWKIALGVPRSQEYPSLNILVDVFDLHCSLLPGLWPMLFLPSLFFLTCFWSRGFVPYSTRRRVRGGSNAKLWYVHISLQSVYLPQRPDSEWHSYKQWVKDLMCTVQTSCHGLGTCTWLKNKHLTCINIWCVFLVKILCPCAVFLEDLHSSIFPQSIKYNLVLILPWAAGRDLIDAVDKFIWMQVYVI